jgi:hypothetical protein
MLERQPITFRGRLVAVASSRHFFLCDDLDDRPPGDPELSFVALMALYATDIAAGNLPGPYTDDHARHFARTCLLHPGVGELLERRCLDVPRAARALSIPADELCAAIAAHIDHSDERDHVDRLRRRLQGLGL